MKVPGHFLAIQGTYLPGNKIIATSNSVAKIGELVTVTGVIPSNVDLGLVYNHKVLLEEASFTQQAFGNHRLTQTN